MQDQAGEGPSDPAVKAPARVPPLLDRTAAWCWRLLVVAAAAYFLVAFLAKIELLVIALFAGILFSALLWPLVALLRLRGAGRGASTGLVLVLALTLLGGVGFFVVNRISAEYPKLVDQVNHVVRQSRHFLVSTLHVDSKNFNNVTDKIVEQLRSHQSQIASGVLDATRTLGEFAAGAVLCFFVTFFLLYDGERIWSWIVAFFPAESQVHVRGAGARSWRTLSGYVTGTFIVALFHGIAVAITLFGLGVPLVIPLAVLVFLGSFIPIIGAVLFGGLAVLVGLVTQGWLAAVILIAVLVIDNQAEAHLLQPLVVGRYVSLHPLAIAIVLTGGGLLAGLPGAIFAVPIVAAANAAVSHVVEARRPTSPLQPELPLEEEVA